MRPKATLLATVGITALLFSSPAYAADTTPPTTPGQPSELSPQSTPAGDADYDADGTLDVAWAPATDPESPIAACELQRRTTSTWTTISSTLTSAQTTLTSGMYHGNRYFFRVRAKNSAGLWGSWSAESDGIYIDTTKPAYVTVTDDGNYTSAVDRLHVVWTASSDSESGIVDYQYLIRQGSIFGTIIVPQTSAGLVTQITRTGLSLVNGTKYYIGVTARNAAGDFSNIKYSNGITVDTVAPTVVISAPANNATASGTNVTVTGIVTENNSMGSVQFKLDGANLGSPDATSPYSITWNTTTAGNGAHVLTAVATDSAGNVGPASSPVTVTVSNGSADTTAPTISAQNVSNISASGATIAWTTNEAATSQVDYGTTTSYGQSTALDSSLVTSHSVPISGLSVGTLYHYRVRSKDAAGNERIGTDATFTTTQAADTVAPTGTITINAGAAATNNRTITLTLAATDNSGSIAQMRFSDNGSTYSTAEAYATTKSWTLPTGDGSKTVYAQFKDAAGNWSAAASDAIVLDTVAPSLSFTSPLDGAVITAP